MKRNLFTITIIGITMFAGLALALQFLSTADVVDTDAISVANQLYSAGNYSEAAQIYEQLLSKGVTDSSLHYNLGNVYFIKGDLGRAILNYQRAARLDPRDADIRTNLRIAREQAGTDSSDVPVNPINSLSRFTISWITLNELALVALVCWFILGFLILAYRQFQGKRIRLILRNGVFLAAFFFMLIGISFAARMYAEKTAPDAVIVADVVTINSNPGEEFATENQLFSGAEVKLLDTQSGWAHLSGPNDVFDGWIPISSFETISWISGDDQPTS